jgi:hypothetical protein
MGSFVIYTLYLTLLGLLNQEKELKGNKVNTREVTNAYNMFDERHREKISQLLYT